MSQVLNVIEQGEKLSFHDSHNYTTVRVLGVPIVNQTSEQTISMIHSIFDRDLTSPRTVFFANAHTLNLAAKLPEFCDALRASDYVFGDGTGVRWGARLRGCELVDNVNGTDLTPSLLRTKPKTRRSYFLLGADVQTIQKAAQFAADSFSNWDQAGYHHGFVNRPSDTDDVIALINRCQPDLLLVGMGNPIQEQWILKNRDRLRAKVCFGIGGLFDFWAGISVALLSGCDRSGTNGCGVSGSSPSRNPNAI